MPTRLILTVNSGSSSLKLGVFDTTLRRLFSAGLDLTSTRWRWRLKDASGDLISDLETAPDNDGFTFALRQLNQRITLSDIVVVGHRLVHGGQRFLAPARLDAEEITALEALVPLAPLHLPPEIAMLKAAISDLPHAVQTGSFDTAFHKTQMRHNSLFAIPRSLIEEGVVRYGFHGLSYDYIASVMGDFLPQNHYRRVIVAHLGSGASLCALKDGVSIATSMGFSALDGLVMGTRPGLLDPGVILYLLRQGRSVDEVENLLYRESGLKGLSGISGDMRVLLASHKPEAAEAVDLFVARASQMIAGLAVELGGLDAIIFTAGIGEHQPVIRERIAARLAHMGVVCDGQKNGDNATAFHDNDSKIGLYVIPTDEEAVIARDALSFL